jgi:hypothetical protein
MYKTYKLMLNIAVINPLRETYHQKQTHRENTSTNKK